MSDAPKPIRRSTQLAPLSREHHEGLLFAWKIRQGLKNGTGAATIARFADWFWEAELKEHFRKEEEVLASALPEGDPLVGRMVEEHQQIEAFLHINAQIPDPALLEQLAAAVHDHIRFEERELFPHAEQVLTKEVLDRIHHLLDTSEVCLSSWQEKFW